MEYESALQYLYDRLPMFTRIGGAAYKTGLGNIEKLCDRFGNPQNNYHVIHVAGTNGKGSTSHMIAAILQACGYKTGLFTSPHLRDFRERVRVNGAMIARQYIVNFVEQHKSFFDEVQPSFFEMNTALAFKYFADQEIQVAVIETGMGGRLDSTNVVNPTLSVITNISYDHKEFLGDTLPKIASEKAGIIKKGVPVVISQTQDEVEHVFRDTAAKNNSEITFADQRYHYEDRFFLTGIQLLNYSSGSGQLIQINTDLPGYYQACNIAGVLAACDELRKKGFIIPLVKQFYALENVKKLTGLAGRWDIANDNPLTIMDVAHNEAGLRFSIEQLKSYKKTNWRLVMGFVRDKELDAVFTLLPKEATYYFCQPDLPRALPVDDLLERASAFRLKASGYSSVRKALDAALRGAGENDLIYVGGSTFVVAEVIGQ